jgi:hypothetical protein
MPRVVPSEVVRVIERFYPWVKQDDKPPEKLGNLHIGRITAIVALCDRLPIELLTLQTRSYADFIADVEILRSRVPYWNQRGSSSETFTPEPVRKIHRALKQCPDDAPTASTQSLQFVADEPMRAALRTDMHHAERALRNHEWKAATVLAGSVIEALLMWRLGTLPSADLEAAAAKVRATGKACGWKTIKPLNDWHLPDYIEVAAIVPETNPVIVADTADLLRVVKHFRNLIHPGRAERLAQTCDKRTAYAAVAGMEGVVIDLSR